MNLISLGLIGNSFLGHRECYIEKLMIRRDLTDALFSDYIRARDKFICQRCGRKYPGNSTSIQCAHIFSRVHKSTRWDPENAVTLCGGCHMYWTREPLEFYEWVIKRIGQEEFDTLRRNKSIPRKVDKKLIRIGLRQLMIDLENEENIFGKH